MAVTADTRISNMVSKTQVFFKFNGKLSDVTRRAITNIIVQLIFLC